MNDVVVFEPRKSRGWLSLLLLALIVLVCTLPVVFAAVAGEVSWWVGFLTYRIPLDEVHAIERRDLSLSLWSSVRLPGLALFAVPYRGMGQVKMCATAATKDILLIETAEGMYGITPADEGGLVAALEARRG
jgi:hypothetical protein